MVENILSWVTENALGVVAIAGILIILVNLVKYKTSGNATIKDIIISAVIFLVVIGLIIAISQYTSYQSGIGEVSKNALGSVTTELGSAVGGKS